MEVILLESIHKLGELGQKVRVKPGYGRNYLVPRGKAVPATEKNLAYFEERRAEFEKAQADALGKAKIRAEALNAVCITIERKSGEEGKLYGSVSTTDIAEAVTAAGVELARHEVRLPDGPFRMTGEYTVDIYLHADVTATVKLVINPEAA
jgi:large subunit ribosomal protein L9